MLALIVSSKSSDPEFELSHLLCRGMKQITYLAHNQETVGATPTPATKFSVCRIIWLFRYAWDVEIAGSNPTTQTKFRKGGRVWLNAAVLKTVVPKGTVGSNPTPSAKNRKVGRVVYCTRLLIGRQETVQEFESLTFRHDNRKGQWKTKK